MLIKTDVKAASKYTTPVTLSCNDILRYKRSSFKLKILGYFIYSLAGAMESNKSKESSQSHKWKTAKEVKGGGGAVDTGKNEKERKGKDSEGVVKGVLHQQVPQPGDFSTEALEKL
ncbi:hypothetical protein J1N35_015264 [Gossypium stocksii]|uniref:Uncharacterized protein n=1 Tax=Gossypium stocksii TaxID=47602 RepID=A0A9D4A8E7_9ROSI|nr:hypothetical protein J1N35_015264 [Gossypium stocksii]